VSVRAGKPRGLPPTLEHHQWLELRGVTDEPVRETYGFAVSLHVDEREEPGPAIPPSVGAIIQSKPSIRGVIGLPGDHFDRVWALATSGLLRYCWLAFTKPRYGSALIVNASFPSERDE
jgi:hypothetical protein